MTGFDSNKTLKAIGIAKDGHVIYGPYNPYSALYGCDDVDMCNGRIMEDGSYAYIATTTAPYFVGCWGPAPANNFYASCSTNTCLNAKLIGVSVLGLLLSVVGFLMM